MGDKLTYNTQTQIYSANSNNANGVSTTKSGRVTVILQPQKVVAMAAIQQSSSSSF